jgi:hypothetical protein
MIQVLGIAVALYMITKMFDLLMDQNGKHSTLTVLLAALTLLASAAAIFVLVTGGSNIASKLGF